MQRYQLFMIRSNKSPAILNFFIFIPCALLAALTPLIIILRLIFLEIRAE